MVTERKGEEIECRTVIYKGQHRNVKYVITYQTGHVQNSHALSSCINRSRAVTHGLMIKILLRIRLSGSSLRPED